MELMLISASLLSFVIAAGMSFIAWRLLREQDERSAARVALLEFVSEDDEAYKRTVAWRTAAPAGSVGPRTLPAAAPGLDSFDIEVSRAALAAEETADDPWDLLPRLAGPVTPEAPALFESTVRRSPSVRVGRIAAAVILLVAAGGIVTTYALGAPFSFFPAARAAPAAAHPLELLSLRHANDEAGTFTVVGMVQNPAAGLPVTGLTAVVYLFDHEGRFFATGRTTVDPATLAAGAESPFVVRVPVTSEVSRYRVGFRLEDGAVVSHVDRRGDVPGGTTGERVDRADDGGPRTSPLPPRRTEG